jgi:hypothetical protein
MDNETQIGDIIWFWHEGFAEPRSGLIVETGNGSRLSTFLFEGQTLDLSNYKIFHCFDDCIKHSLRHGFSRWR